MSCRHKKNPKISWSLRYSPPPQKRLRRGWINSVLPLFRKGSGARPLAELHKLLFIRINLYGYGHEYTLCFPISVWWICLYRYGPNMISSHFFHLLITSNPIGWVCRIHRLHLYRGVRPSNKSPGHETKQSDDEALVMLELWGMQCTLSLPSLPGQLCPGVEAPDRILPLV